VAVTAKDSGPGIPKDKLEMIFAQFYSIKPGGLGMGLAICRSIVKSQGGNIWAENIQNGGAVICFNLPIPVELKS
jgi:two-component system sensor histidine kinase DctS